MPTKTATNIDRPEPPRDYPTPRKPIKPSKAMRKIIRSGSRFIEVMAVPGGAKTTTAVFRVERLVAQDPEACIQVVSSTNATVINFVSRLSAASIDTAKVSVSTIHALTNRLIRQHYLQLGYRAPPSVIDGPGKTKILKQIDGGARPRSGNTASAGRSSNRAAHPKGSASTTDRAQAYRDHKRSSNAIDYDDMLRLGLRLITKLSATELGIDQLIVDEWQDCTPIQARLIAALASRVKTTVVLGDRLQMIYGFAGGRYTPLASVLEQAEADEEVETFQLRRSYRLTARIADLAMAVAKPFDPPTIKTSKEGKRPILLEASDTRALGVRVAKRIQKLLDSGVPCSEIALLGRTRAVLHPVAQELAARNVATLLAGSSNYYQAVFDVLYLADKLEDLRDYGIGIDHDAGGRRARLTADLEADLRERLGLDVLAASLEPTSGGKSVDAARAGSISEPILPHADRWERFVDEFLAIAGKPHFSDLYRACVKAYLRLHGGIQAHKTLRNALNRWDAQARGFDGAAAMSAHVQEMASNDCIICSTIHAAKGMEWDYVFVLGVTQGVLPDRRAVTAEQLDEERRSLYVAITRARKCLWLCHSPVKVSGVRREYELISPFVDTRASKVALAVPGRP